MSTVTSTGTPLINAVDLANITKQALVEKEEKKYEEEFELLKKQIAKSASQGLFETSFCFELTRSNARLRKTLLEHGYVVLDTCDTNYNGDRVYKITWNEKTID
jgi:histidinol-phosphate/aromatic aminotransferase/cobyric acid decarboxylase-like protein